MSTGYMGSMGKTSLIRAAGRLEEYRREISGYREMLEKLPLWRPSAGLARECAEALKMLDDLEARFERKLVITVIGPTGSGKSTLLNALAGVDELSPTGVDRPTTKKAVVLAKKREDADELEDRLGKENTQVKTSPAAGWLENAVVIDTPDLDSVEKDEHLPVLEKALSVSDILICVFNGENPKRRDHVDYLAPSVRLFGGDSIICAINKCDRLDEKELTEFIRPDFANYIEEAWERPPSKIMCVSARKNLKNPDWEGAPRPKHDFDEFEDLVAVLFGSLKTPGFLVDTRLENAAGIARYIRDEISREAGWDAESLSMAVEEVKRTEKEALEEAFSAIAGDSDDQALGVNVLLYNRLSAAWSGPVGWIITLWARILIFGSGMVAAFRFGNPVRQLMGVFSSLVNYRSAKAAVLETRTGGRLEAGLKGYQKVFRRQWPDIAESLVSGRFDYSVRIVEDRNEWGKGVLEELQNAWRDSVSEAIESHAQAFSGFFLQLLLNLPTLGLLAHTGWITVKSWFKGVILSGDFFLHAFVTIGIALFLSFFLLQFLLGIFAGRKRIIKKAFVITGKKVKEAEPGGVIPARDQAAGVLDLLSLAGENR